MWTLTRRYKKQKDDLNGIKTVRVNGYKYKIRKINPLLDFSSERMPQIFSHILKRKKVDPERELTEAEAVRRLEDMKMTVKAGIVDPPLSNSILTIDDIFRWGDTGAKLYLEILAHSLNQFRGLKGVFFSIKTRRSLYSAWLKSSGDLLLS